MNIRFGKTFNIKFEFPEFPNVSISVNKCLLIPVQLSLICDNSETSSQAASLGMADPNFFLSLQEDEKQRNIFYE